MANIYTDKTFETEVKQEKGLVLVDFYADWCGPCKMMAPIIDSIADEYTGKIKVGKVNIDDYPNLAMEYKVLSIPTVILFKDGEKKDTIIGLVSKTEVEELISKNM